MDLCLSPLTLRIESSWEILEGITESRDLLVWGVEPVPHYFRWVCWELTGLWGLGMSRDIPQLSKLSGGVELG